MNSSSLRTAERCCRERRWDVADFLYRRAVSEDSGPDAHLAYGRFLADRQRFHPAIVQLMHGLDAAQCADDAAAQAYVFSSLATIYRELGDYDLAQRFQRQALAIHAAADAGDLLDWAADALLAGKLILAEELARGAWLLVEETDDVETQADAQGLLGMIAARQGDHRTAVALLIRAARSHRGLGDDRGLGVDCLNLGEIVGLLGRTTWQRRFFSAARNYFSRAGMPAAEARAERRLQDLSQQELYRRMAAGWN
jgi:tetratricopeptide (TPR) repeat protein